MGGAAGAVGFLYEAMGALSLSAGAAVRIDLTSATGRLTRDELPNCYALRNGASGALHLDPGRIGDIPQDT